MLGWVADLSLRDLSFSLWFFNFFFDFLIHLFACALLFLVCLYSESIFKFYNNYDNVRQKSAPKYQEISMSITGSLFFFTKI